MPHVVCSIFYKEFFKTRLGMVLLLGGNALFMGWLWLDIRRLFLLDHPEIVWYRVMDLGQIPYMPLTFLPAICGCIFCCFQFLPEMRDERLRISLHLPCAMPVLILSHLLYGLTFLSLLFALNALALILISHAYFPPDAVLLALQTTAPWFLAGLYAYLCMTCCLLEPRPRARLLGLLLGGGLCAPLLIRTAPGSLAPCLPAFLLLMPLLVIGLLLPALHYRHRRTE